MDAQINYSLRRAAPLDAAGLQQMCWPNWSIESVAEMLHRVERLVQQKRGFGLVAESAEQLLGYGQLTLWPRTTEISDLIVAPGYRRQGIGSAIVCALADHVRLLGLPQVEIGVALSNPDALRLYRRLGFQDNRTIEIDLGHGQEPVLYLSMSLNGQSDGSRAG